MTEMQMVGRRLKPSNCAGKTSQRKCHESDPERMIELRLNAKTGQEKRVLTQEWSERSSHRVTFAARLHPSL